MSAEPPAMPPPGSSLVFRPPPAVTDPAVPPPASRRRYQPPPLGPMGIHALLLLLIELWLLNVADLVLTKYGIWLGFATESNGVMSFLLRAGTVPTIAFKVGIVTVGALLLWRLRRHRAALFAAVLLTGVLAAVVVYQVFWIVSL
jgi:hypothetical protein